MIISCTIISDIFLVPSNSCDIHYIDFITTQRDAAFINASVKRDASYIFNLPERRYIPSLVSYCFLAPRTRAVYSRHSHWERQKVWQKHIGRMPGSVIF